MPAQTPRRRQLSRCGVIAAVLGSGLVSPLAAEPLNFTNEAVVRGVPFRLGFNYHQVGAGNMLVDLDNDGDLDIL
ncbi:MAG: hypothetical protein NXI07_13550, partial [bacterium]|nr:hypothetical protein [bacterium]